MSNSLNSTAASQPPTANSRFDLLVMLGRAGIRTLKMKLFLVILGLTGLSILITCLAALLGFNKAIETGAGLRYVAGSNAETADLLIAENIRFVRTIANDEVIVAAAERSAVEAEKAGINHIPDETEIRDLEERYKASRALSTNEAVNDFLRDKRSFKGVYDRLFFTNRYGLNVGMTSMPEDFVQSDEGWWQEAMKKGWSLSDVKFDPQTKAFSLEINIAIPSPKGGYNGVLKAKYNLQDVQDFIGRFRQYQSGYAFAVNRQGQVVLHPDAGLRNLGIGEALTRLGYSEAKNIESQLTSVASRQHDQQGGTIYSEGINGKTHQAEERILSFEVSKGFSDKSIDFPGFGWVFVVDNSKAEVTAPASRMIWIIGAIGLASALLFGGLAFLFARGVSGKIENFLSVTEQVSAGRMDAQVRISTGDELETLAGRFNTMVWHLVESARAEKEQREAIRQSEARYRDILSSVEDGYYEVDLADSLVFFNDSFLRISGYSGAELKGLKFSELAIPETWDGVREAMKETRRTGTPNPRVEYQVMRKDGAIRSIEISIALIRDEQDQPKGFRGVFRDVTDRLEAEAEVRRNWEFLAQILNSLREPIFVKNEKHQWILLNEAFCALVGRTKKELMGKTDYDFFPKEQADIFWEKDNKVFTTGVSDENEESNTDAFGVTRTVITRKALLTDSSGQRVLVGVIRDITSDKQAETALRTSREFLENVIDAMTDPILVKDDQLRLVLVNDAACRLDGNPKEKLIGKTLYDRKSKEEADKGTADDMEFLTTGRGAEFEETKFSPDGEMRHMITRKSSFTDSSGKRFLVITLRDNTARKQAEEAVRRNENRLHRIVESLDEVAVEIDSNGTYVNIWTNNTLLLGRPREEMLGRRIDELNSAEAAAHQMAVIRRVLETGKAATDEYPNNTGRWIMSRVSAIPAADGVSQNVCLLGRDITERREAEEALQHNLAAFLEAASAVSEGDLTRRAKEGEDVLGLATKAVNVMLDNFSTMLAEVRQIGLSVSSSATQIQAASEQIATGSQRQADEITNTSSAVEEMAASMKQVSKNSEASADAARRALQMAENGDRSMRLTTEAMSRIESAVQKTSEKMRVLGTRSSEISEIIDLINEIAAQTNLLALNAAIEAAHAGQAGLGFSVVADEIRKLAERSSRATKDVGNLIKSVQNEITETVAAMETGANEVQGGTRVAQEAGQALQEISSAVRQSAELIEEISAASEEQATITVNLAEAMQIISGITIETSAGAHETAQTLQGMVGLSEQLNKAISQFKVNSEPPSASFRVSASSINPGQLRGTRELTGYLPQSDRRA